MGGQRLASKRQQQDAGGRQSAAAGQPVDAGRRQVAVGGQPPDAARGQQLDTVRGQQLGPAGGWQAIVAWQKLSAEWQRPSVAEGQQIPTAAGQRLPAAGEGGGLPGTARGQTFDSGGVQQLYQDVRKTLNLKEEPHRHASQRDLLIANTKFFVDTCMEGQSFAVASENHPELEGCYCADAVLGKVPPVVGQYVYSSPRPASAGGGENVLATTSFVDPSFAEDVSLVFVWSVFPSHVFICYGIYIYIASLLLFTIFVSSRYRFLQLPFLPIFCISGSWGSLRVVTPLTIGR